MKNNLKLVSELIEEFTQDIEHIDAKDYLSMALASHIERGSGLPREYVNEVVHLYFEGFKL